MMETRRSLLKLTGGALTAAAASCATAQEPRYPRVAFVFESGVVSGILRPDKAPQHVARFTQLCRQHFYDNLSIVRVAPGHVVQGGDPLFTGEGGSGQTIPAEFNDLPHIRGAIGMARDENPDSADSQFYICLADRPHLNGRYTVFGQVEEGMPILDGFQPGDAPMGFISERARQPRLVRVRVFA